MMRAQYLPALATLLFGASAWPALDKRAGSDSTQPVGTNVVKIANVTLLGNLTADNSCSHRDLGFTGVIQGKTYSVFGDTLWCAPGVMDPSKDDQSTFHGLVRDSVSVATSNPLLVHDLHLNNDSPVPHQLQLVPFNSSWGETQSTGFGGTSLCETDPTNHPGEAALYYLVNQNDAGLVGAGVARVDVISGTPTVVQRYGTNGYWWNYKNVARYGDAAAYKDVNSDYIYLIGGAPNISSTDFVQSSYVYQARVHSAQAFNLSAYQYWWGPQVGFNSTILSSFNSNTAVMWNVGQGQILYSNYYKTYFYVHLDLSSEVVIRTASNPYGPWTADVVVYKVQTSSGGSAYAGVIHPQFDTTHQTLIISYTNYPNDIQVRRPRSQHTLNTLLTRVQMIKVTFTK